MEKIRDLQTATGKHVKTKVADIQRLYSKWLWLLMAVYKPLFSDAEFHKDIPQYLICGNFTTHNFGQMEKAFT